MSTSGRDKHRAININVEAGNDFYYQLPASTLSHPLDLIPLFLAMLRGFLIFEIDFHNGCCPIHIHKVLTSYITQHNLYQVFSSPRCYYLNLWILLFLILTVVLNPSDWEMHPAISVYPIYCIFSSFPA